MLFGFVVYLLINYQVEGDPFRFLYYQSNHWYNGFAPIWTTLHYIIQNAITDWYTSTGMCLWVPELVLFLSILQVSFMVSAGKCVPCTSPT